MISKMHKQEKEGGRIGIVFNGSPLFTGDAGSGESEIRRWIIESDWLEAVVGLPDQMFYNTGIFTYIWIVTNRKEPHRRGKVQLVNATSFYQKMRKSLGDKRNELSPKHIDVVTRLYAEFKEGENVRIFDNRDFGYVKLTVERPLKLNFQANAERLERLAEQGAFAALAESKKRKSRKEIEAEEAAGRAMQATILKALTTVDSNVIYRSRPSFLKVLDKALDAAKLKIGAPVRKAILNALSERDDTADICTYDDVADADPEPDPDLRDTENVSLPPDFPLPIPLEYGERPDNSRIVRLVRQHCDAYFEREVRPHLPEAWIDYSKTKIGFEIPFNRHFYKYVPPRALDEIDRDIRTIEKEFLRLLRKVAA
jgi:type I restriction enzyme M protein